MTHKTTQKREEEVEKEVMGYPGPTTLAIASGLIVIAAIGVFIAGRKRGPKMSILCNFFSLFSFFF